MNARNNYNINNKSCFVIGSKKSNGVDYPIKIDHSMFIPEHGQQNQLIKINKSLSSGRTYGASKKTVVRNSKVTKKKQQPPVLGEFISSNSRQHSVRSLHSKDCTSIINDDSKKT